MLLASTTAFAPRSAEPNPLREAIARAQALTEPETVAPLLAQARVPDALEQAIEATAARLTRGLRARSNGFSAGMVQGMLQEFSLASEEGIALMCLAEALLRIPDAATRDELIRDKIGGGAWQGHLGKSPHLFVNATVWGLLLTGRLVEAPEPSGMSASLHRLGAKGAEPLVRAAVDAAVGLMARQFVAGESIEQALARARAREAQGFRHSYDMLGEAALTEAQAQHYLAAYCHAIEAVGRAALGRGIHDGPGVSIKLTALHPRYSRAQYARVMSELYPRLLRLARAARSHGIALHIDAEESERLELSLDLLEKLCQAPELAGWNGLGFVLQAYQRRCASAIDFVIDLARRHQRMLLLRLVKGAYWDSEIKRAQVLGLDGYPVFTRKAHTDVSYIACARRLLAAPDAVYPQFATHNARTLATVYHLAAAEFPQARYEFQCLHGMGEPLYEQVVGSAGHAGLGRTCRIYAPVGGHAHLLGYLVRRLLENGANSSFVHQAADTAVALPALLHSPVARIDEAGEIEGVAGAAHPNIPLPAALFGARRANSRGLDLADESSVQAFAAVLAQQPRLLAKPLIARPLESTHAPRPVHNPARREEVVGQVQEADAAQVEAALAEAGAGFAAWGQTPVPQRAQCLLRAADAFEQQMLELMALLVREGGKTAANALAEVREAVDFLRYYATQAARDFHPETHRALGPVACISPWNFPLAIFTGQVAAALAAGNAVLAKPARQTPLIAAHAVRLLHAAGVPLAALQLLPGAGADVGSALVADARVMGVVFTGSTEVARQLAQALSHRLRPDGQPVVLIAETGGLNAMLVDSTALAEQAVPDILASAFDSAGQRCSALRILCVQEDCAEPLLQMLDGAMRQLQVGDPRQLATDVGPVIDAQAQAGIEQHVEAMRAKGYVMRQCALPAAAAQGSFVAPTVIEIERMGDLEQEVFGPVLHVLRYPRARLDALLGQINGTGYGLTQGLHSRLTATTAQVTAACRAGNLYVNRNTIGAVVGVQPFGGEGLSGTGPKAGGPLYLRRLLASHPADAREVLLQEALAPQDAPGPAMHPALQALQRWAETSMPALAERCALYAGQSPADLEVLLPGPTGERNSLRLVARPATLCLSSTPEGALWLLAAVLAVGGHAVWPAELAALHARLPAPVARHLLLVSDWAQALADRRVRVDAVLHAGPAESLLPLQQRLAARAGALPALIHVDDDGAPVPLERLLIERVVSTNTAAAGGNASLMALGGH
ncbi:bifunctional proline dehydrogenase/L-glutamate gamma-semialdehyde dehydrogenase PutA [Comamonas endophytica]|uniref:Bifunctional protein PutA n=1 Tax=Comamonas endophytica TaxID=2949090 RepID=A0ABY6G900_9BURK|nr:MULTISPECIES: bifunctional proline dehydrogenase/L-glutamate gamma-semialdehyde dehydrogenase PutA [unclassified Acidovorax]MCD2514254.1 bifunctional proline dehydrogenase/L-glutamate gamma-semialdehyde dehydrogenase PutA [Acidovorax sp. D4N7]UYG51393.1 bifunctional proline dehydrogenase/L-glutamate gamma-semialdehyde dehydrogenase PutA [Acidovorax sp. 5MLIR]